MGSFIESLLSFSLSDDPGISEAEVST
jgi:hypothetical protein